MTISIKGAHFAREVILHTVFFYLRYGVSYRDLEENMAEYGVDLDHAALNRWVGKYGVLVDEAARSAVAASNLRVKPRKPTSPGAIARNEAVNTSTYLGRSLWRRGSGYHRQSPVESKMHCVNLTGQSHTARDVDRQVAGIQSRITVLNRYTSPGIPVTDTVG